MVQRLLYKRFYGHGFSFSLVPLGNVELPGPLTMSYPDSVGKVTTGNRTTLVHWNSNMQYWEISSKTCTHLTAEEQEMYDPNTQTMTVKVCSTYNVEPRPAESRQKRSLHPAYFSRETMFILADTAASIYNSPPSLISIKDVNILEDSGIVKYQLEATDEEGDTIKFKLQDKTFNLGGATLSSDGL
ncbi:uncharacterized protein LOC134232798 [Saccostrea cucullata]|uniref:uncharacterized protein LOC134232798 n=1 Tax=Saccostrea cuccullata TaxID=36930 RepID=UPI002ED0B8F7